MLQLNSEGLLPKRRLEVDLKVTLGSVIEDRVSVLQQQRPRIYQDLLSDYLNPFPLPEQAQSSAPIRPATVLPSDLPFYWQQLILPDRSVCSELILMSWRHVTYINYLNILPADFGLFAPLKPLEAMSYVNKLIVETLNNIAALTKAQGNLGMVTTLTNPNLAAIFKHQHFKESPAGPMIVGLPLPARFYRLLY